MTDHPRPDAQKPEKVTRATIREDRRKVALKENMAKRKALIRARTTEPLAQEIPAGVASSGNENKE